MKTKIPTVAEVQELQVQNYEKNKILEDKLIDSIVSRLLDVIINKLKSSEKFPIEFCGTEYYDKKYRESIMEKLRSELTSVDPRYRLSYSVAETHYSWIRITISIL